MSTDKSISKVTKKHLGDVVTALHRIFSDEIYATPENELDRYWHFHWDDTKSTEENIYQFYEMLKLYDSHCSRWEEHHNGIICLVGRVRDKYLMPKIREFLSTMENKEGKSRVHED